MLKTMSIPIPHLEAIKSRAKYFDLHRQYARAYGMNDRQAYEKLENDLNRFNLPNIYTSIESFYSERCRLTARFMRVNTKS